MTTSCSTEWQPCQTLLFRTPRTGECVLLPCSAQYEEDTGEDKLGELHAADFQAGVCVALEPSPSVYDEALIVPLYHGRLRNGGWRIRCSNVLVMSILLGVNMALQAAVLLKLKGLSDTELDRVSGDLWSVCQEFPADKLSVKMRLNETPGEGVFFDCSPLTVSIMTSVERLDLDGDGYWSSLEAESGEKHLIGVFPGRQIHLVRAFRGLMKMVSSGEMISQYDLDESSYRNHTKNFTALPMNWLVKEQRLDLCGVATADLCGNLEVRQALHRIFPDESLPQLRITACELAVDDYCPRIFGERYKFYSLRTEELCGEPYTIWHTKMRVRMVVYENSYTYNDGPNAIVKLPYISFLVVILTIWCTAMLQEMRNIITWWQVLLFIPTFSFDIPIISLLDDKFEVNWIPALHKYLTLTLNLLPRTLICCGLIVIGSQFLIRADNCEDLILNSVALGFLIEIDSMLYAAVVADDHKKVLTSCEPLKIRRYLNPATDWCEEKIGPTVLYTIFTLLSVFTFVVTVYGGPGGKMAVGDALNCLCQVSGYNCLGTQILGGLAFVPAKYGMSTFLL